MRNYTSEINLNHKNLITIGDFSDFYSRRLRSSRRRIYNPVKASFVSSLKNQDIFFDKLILKIKRAHWFNKLIYSFKTIGKEELIIGILTICNFVLSGFLVLV